MIQFNLLPDVKIEYIKAKRTKRLVASVSVLSAAACVVIAALVFIGVNIVQKQRMTSLNADITATAKLVQATPNINRIITVQNQLSSLTALHAAKPAATRLYDYLGQVVPENVTLSKATVDFTANTITLTGNAKDLLGVNTLVDTLKFTSYKLQDQSDSAKAFSKVVLTSFAAALAGNVDNKGASYTVSLAYDPIVFDNQKSLQLLVPQTVTTHSQLSSSAVLFQPNPIKEGIK
jgi:Tfp pilus assembly protein PilN